MTKRNDQPLISSRTTVLVGAIVILCTLVAAFVLALTWLRPERDQTSTITIVLGVMVPVIAGLLAAAVQQVHLAVNSRLTQLLELTAKANLAAGIEQERIRTDDHP